MVEELQKNCHPEEFFISYFTSSKIVFDVRMEFGEPDIIKIHKIFSDIDSCKCQEEKFLKRVKASNSLRWLNQTNGDRNFDNSCRVVVHSEETKLKIKRSLTGKTASEETRFKMSISSSRRDKRKPHTEKSRQKISKNRTGKLKGIPKTQEVKDKLSKFFSGKKFSDDQKKSIKKSRKIKTCPYCGIFSRYNMPRYHFDNCKSKPLN
jgi:ABC-type phosphate transport system ATPase subunit